MRSHIANPGDRFGRGVVVREYKKMDGEGTKYPQMRWFADLKCDCGRFYTTRVKHLYATPTPTTSCGCAHKEVVSELGKSRTTHGLSRHPLYGTWHSIRARITNPETWDYSYYGGRGIEMYPEWLDSPAHFIEYVESNLGPKRDGRNLVRIDKNKNYEPGNIRWADE